MKAAVLSRQGFELCDVAEPVVADDDVLVETLACGICTGNLHVYQNRAELAAIDSRLGHEATGKVVSCGRNVSTFKPGEIVTALGAPAFAEYFTAQESHLVKLAPQIDPIYALGEAVACCVHAANRFGIQPGDKVAVAGCGFMGLVCLQLARIQGAGFICAIDLAPDRLAMSLQFGADETYNALQASGADIVGEQGPFDVVIEAAGSQSAIDLCTELVTQHGRIILIGYHQSNNGLRTVNMQQWNFKAIDVINGHVRRQDEKVIAMQQGMDLMRSGALTTKPMSTVYLFAQVEEAFQDLSAGKPGLMKAVLQMTTD